MEPLPSLFRAPESRAAPRHRRVAPVSAGSQGCHCSLRCPLAPEGSGGTPGRAAGRPAEGGRGGSGLGQERSQTLSAGMGWSWHAGGRGWLTRTGAAPHWGPVTSQHISRGSGDSSSQHRGHSGERHFSTEKKQNHETLLVATAGDVSLRRTLTTSQGFGGNRCSRAGWSPAGSVLRTPRRRLGCRGSGSAVLRAGTRRRASRRRYKLFLSLLENMLRLMVPKRDAAPGCLKPPQAQLPRIPPCPRPGPAGQSSWDEIIADEPGARRTPGLTPAEKPESLTCCQLKQQVIT